MSYLLITFLIVALVPLFSASWRASLFGISLQGFLLGWITWRVHAHLSALVLLALVDAVVVRGIVAPRVLHRVLAARHAPHRNDTIPASLLAWALVAALVFVSFRFAAAILKSDLPGGLHLSIATAALLLGMFVLSSQNSMFSQMMGLFRIENAIALFELMIPHHLPIPIQAGVSVVFLLTVVYFRRFLYEELQSMSQPQLEEERPTL